jgi:DNA-binding GntR family transcriptional regulator
MKPDTVFKQAYNTALDLISTYGSDVPLPSENELSGRLRVSRTTTRKVLMQLSDRGFIHSDGKLRRAARQPEPGSYFPRTETVSTSHQVETQFMEWMLRGDAKPGTLINELDLARQFGVATTGIREFLNQFRRFGVIEKRPNAGWLFKGFTDDFATELFEIREMFELRSVRVFAELPATHPVWQELQALRAEHIKLLSEIDRRFHDFSDLDNRFHRLVNAAAPNRFIDDFYDIVTLIFHYHYQWNKRDERQRNEVAIKEHLDYIDALLSRDRRAIGAACRAHLASAKLTLMQAVSL